MLRRVESIRVSLRILTALTCFLAGAALAGEVHGTITMSGPLPTRPTVDRTLDPACGKAPPGDDPLMVSAAGAVQNAVVRIVGAAPVAPAASPESKAPVVVRQKGCSYLPRVQAALRGQPLLVENQDPLLHDLHAFSGRKGLFNVAQPAGSPPVKRDLAGIDVLRLKCDIHPWMFGWVIFNDTPSFAVTGADGRFAIRGLAPGDYKLAVWHELLGTREIEIHVPAGSLEVKVEFSSQ